MSETSTHISFSVTASKEGKLILKAAGGEGRQCDTLLDLMEVVAHRICSDLWPGSVRAGIELSDMKSTVEIGKAENKARLAIRQADKLPPNLQGFLDDMATASRY